MSAKAGKGRTCLWVPGVGPDADALERLAHATKLRSPLTASPLQACSVRGDRNGATSKGL